MLKSFLFNNKQKTNKMRNKKAWLRIAEAFIAILLIAGVLIYLYSNASKSSKSEQIYSIEKTILNDIASDDALRSDILNNNIDNARNFAFKRIPSGYSFELKICEVNDICNLNTYKEEVYSSEKVISSTLQKYNPKKLKIFMWVAK